MWNERYAQPGFAYGTEPNEFLVEHAAALQSPVLSLAEGEGRNAVWLAAKGLAVTAVDASDVGLAKARALAVERGIALGTGAPGGSLVTVVADLAEYAVVESAWGSIVSIWCHVPPVVRRRLHAACVRGLVPGGVLLLEAYTPDQIARGTGGPRDAALTMTLEALREELAGLEIVVGRERVRDVHEGTFHEGASAVVQLLAKKPA